MTERASLSADLRARLDRIKLVALDVDGVLTDGGMYYAESGDEWKKFNTRDGKGIEILRASSFRVVIITQESTKIVARRAEKLGVDLLLQGITDKAAALRDVAQRMSISLDEIAYVGDDFNDLPAMKIAGFAVTVADGMPPNKEAAHYVTAARGGEGAVRELSLLLVPGQGRDPVRAGMLLLCRMGSTRLPGKALAQVAGRPILEHQIERLKTARLPERIVLCTSRAPEDDALAAVARRHGLAAFRGDPDDVVLRMRDAAREHDLDIVVATGADDPLSDPDSVDAIIEHLRSGTADFVWYPDLPVGASPFGVTAAALDRLCRIKTGGTDGWELYFTASDLFRTVAGNVADPVLRRPDVRLTLDYPEDLEFFRQVFAALHPSSPRFSLRDVIRLLDMRPDIAQLNQGVAERWVEQRRSFSIAVKEAAP